MPVRNDVPDVLAVALGRMEDAVQAFKSDIAYKAPEQYDLMYAGLQLEIANAMFDLYNEARDDGPAE